jgi:pyruvate dehydrogenase E1 component alpha subunit
MSDPAKYRTKEELEEYKEKDPIENVLRTIQENNLATAEEIAEMNDRVKAIVDDCVEFAENSPLPDISEVYKDIYLQEDYPFIMD